MNFFKQILSLILLFSILSMDAKRRGAQAARITEQPARTAPTQPSARPQKPTRPTPAQQQPVTQPETYAQALDAIKRMSSNEVLINNTFNPEFINFIESLNLSPLETIALLQAGANIHATWTDNNVTNKSRLLSLRNSIQTITQTQPTTQPQPVIWQNQPTMQPKPEYIQPIVQPRAIEIPKPIMPIEQARPVIAPKPITQPNSINQVPRDLLGKVKKLEGYDGIYVGAGISAAGEPIFFAMEKLNDERNEVWQKYVAALLTSYYTQVVARLRKLNNKCDDIAFLETLNNDPYTKKLMEQMCPQKKKFSALFGNEDGIGGGIVGLDQMLHRYSNDGDVVYVAYASSKPITGPFKPKKKIDVSSFTLEDFETAYSDIIICVAVDMLQNLKFPISTEHRGIFKNPFNEIRGGYKNIGIQLHAWAGTVEEQFFNKKYMTVFPTEHAAKLLHSSTKKGEMFLGTDKNPFPYNNYYKNDEELKLIKEKFPPIQQDLIGDAPTTSRGGSFESLHVYPLNTLSRYYTNQGKGQ